MLLPGAPALVKGPTFSDGKKVIQEIKAVFFYDVHIRRGLQVFAFGNNNLAGQSRPGLHQVIDQSHQIIAMTFEHPPDWQAVSQLAFNFNFSMQPLLFHAQVTGPQDNAIEFFGPQQFCWLEPYMGFNQPGQPLGDGTTLLPPMSAADTLLKAVLPRFRNPQTMRIVEVQAMPQLPQALHLNLAPTVSHEGICLRTENQQGPGEQEEEFYVVNTINQGMPSYGAAGQIVQYNWGFSKFFAFRAQKGKLDQYRQTFWNIINSTHPNPQWEQVYNQVMQQMQQRHQMHLQAGYASIQQASQLSQMNIAASREFYNHQSQQIGNEIAAFQQQQANYGQGYTYDQTAAMNDILGGTRTFDDPFYSGGKQHSCSEQYVWANQNQQDDYVYSDDPGFNPNVGSTQQYVRVSEKQLGDKY